MSEVPLYCKELAPRQFAWRDLNHWVCGTPTDKETEYARQGVTSVGFGFQVSGSRFWILGLRV